MLGQVSDTLQIDEHDTDGVHVLALSGELDIMSAPDLAARIDDARGHGLRRVLVDLTAVDFCDSTGLRALIGASTEIRVGGGRLAVACLPGGAISRLFDMVGARETLRVFDSQAEALSSVSQLPT